MRIGLITGEYPPDRGGVGDFTNHLGQSLAAFGHQVHVITSPSPSNREATQLPEGATGSNHVSVHRVVRNWGFRCWKRILEVSRNLELDALDIQYQAAAYAMRPTINFVPPRAWRPAAAVTFHDLKVPYLFPKAGPLRPWVVHLLARRSDGVIVTNRQDQISLEALNPPPANMTRIPIGSNIPSQLPRGYDRDAERARWGLGPEDILLGYFGFFNESKGGEVLIEALDLLVREGLPAHLLKVGGRTGSSDRTNRDYAERVDALVIRRGLENRVHRTGYVSPKQVSSSLGAVDVCVLPYRDGVSFRRGSLLACLAHGRPVVTTHPIISLPAVKDGENMLLVKPDDPIELAQAARSLVANPRLRTQLEAGARALAAHFSWDRIAERTTAFLDTLIES